MRRPRLPLIVPAALLTTAGLALAFSSGPPASYTGALSVAGVPGEPNCTLCHSGNPLNAATGAVRILNVPKPYLPGGVYTLTVELSSDRTAGPPGRKWGFEITAVRADNGQGTGTFAVVDPDTRVVTGASVWASRTYVEHISTGTRTGQVSPVQWQLQWTAPDQPAPYQVYFFAAGNAANGNGFTTGDFIYTTAETTTVDVTPIAPATWGQVKSRYRQ